jgi:Brp/Blh family beta-carotene 15,15'-monooxygenase
LISTALFGLPHGACDHLVAGKITGVRRARRGAVVGFFSLYLIGFAATVVLWIASSAAALGVFLCLTVWHWGSADSETFRDAPAPFALRSVGRGLLVVAAPLAFHHAASWAALSSLLGIFGPEAATPAWVGGLGMGCLLGGVLLESLLVVRDIGRRQEWRAARASFEVLLLLALFYVVSPVTAVGIYFVAWHAWRHTLRTGALLDPHLSADPWSLVTVYHSRALPLMLVSAVALAALTLAVGRSGPEQLSMAYLILLSALTLPHAAVVFVWDYSSPPGRHHRPRPLPDPTQHAISEDGPYPNG